MSAEVLMATHTWVVSVRERVGDNTYVLTECGLLQYDPRFCSFKLPLIEKNLVLLLYALETKAL